jgi:hypothetical protein
MSEKPWQFQPGNHAGPEGRSAPKARRARRYAEIEAELISLTGAPLTPSEAMTLSLAVNLWDRAERSKVDDRTSERGASTSARLIRQLKADRTKAAKATTAKPQSLQDAVRAVREGPSA